MIIQQRVTDDCPVVTFQDNMQLMRTSLRHLRLSKLHKVKQNKMWDFTVRGWRVADITGIEDLFQDESTFESQQVVKNLKFNDMLIAKTLVVTVVAWRVGGCRFQCHNCKINRFVLLFCR